ncbi:4894_t:CDS:2 [Ambispora gerdemannii]|uniref:4894_t:CDS:1 n=1 Tax=Ambispora gerdemannii TaxID=144530 RepID=A0A9N9FM68_9GLOM|nr:4894_t:CDS:2 [Ambispora gerdemannii]
MNFCTTCNNYLPAEVFIYKNKTYKTCANCLDARSRKRAAKKQSTTDDNQPEKKEEIVYEEVAFAKIVDYITSKTANLNENDVLSFNLRVKLDTAQHDAKNMVKLIVDEIEGFDGYDWVFTTGPEMSLRHHDVGLFIWHVHNAVNLSVNIRCQTEREWIILTVMNLHMDPIQLRTHLRQMFDISLITEKQIYYWWSTYCQRFYKLDEDHIISARRFFDGSHTESSELCFDWNTDLVTAIGFTTPLLAKLLPLSSVHCDATYKTARGCFELYGIISNVEGAGFPIAYLALNTTKAQDIEEQTGEKLKSRKRIYRNQYQPNDAVVEFDFIDPAFKPDLERSEPEYYMDNS